jgi:UDP-2,3-diacylglucosamine hydrolase
MERIGLIAGNRRFPLLVSEQAQKQGVSLVVAAIKGETSTEIRKFSRTVRWFSLGEFSGMFDFFKQESVKKVIMAGQISPVRLFSREVRDSRQIQELLTSIKDRKANSIFLGLARKLSEQSLELIDSTTFVKDYLPQKGVLTQREPSASEKEDIKFGIDLARKIADLDIGLSVGVKQKAILAIEALEGTDNLIRRAGALARSGAVIAKVGRPNQDMRFDIPVIGLATVKTLVSAKASCLAIEAGKTLFLDLQESLALADRRNISIVAV